MSEGKESFIRSSERARVFPGEKVQHGGACSGVGDVDKGWRVRARLERLEVMLKEEREARGRCERVVWWRRVRLGLH